MGQNLQKEKDLGELTVKLQNAQIISGQAIHGRVILKLNKDVPVNQIYVVFRGKEQIKLAKWGTGKHTVTAMGTSSRDIDVIPQFINQKKKSKFDTRQNRRLDIDEDSEQIIAQTINVFNPQPGNFTKGQHILNFTLQTPQNLPNSFYYNFMEHGEKCKAVIKYEVAAGLMLQDQRGIFGKEKLLVQSRFPMELAQFQQAQQKEIKPEFLFQAKINKSYFMVGDQLIANVYCDNTKQKYDINKIKWKLVQYLKIKNRDNSMKKELRLRVFKETLGDVKKGQSINKDFHSNIQLAHNSQLTNHVSVNSQFIENVYKIEFYAVTKQFWVIDKNHQIDFDLHVYEQQDVQQLIRTNSQPVLLPPGYVPQQNFNTQPSYQNPNFPTIIPSQNYNQIPQGQFQQQYQTQGQQYQQQQYIYQNQQNYPQQNLPQLNLPQQHLPQLNLPQQNLPQQNIQGDDKQLWMDSSFDFQKNIDQNLEKNQPEQKLDDIDNKKEVKVEEKIEQKIVKELPNEVKVDDQDEIEYPDLENIQTSNLYAPNINSTLSK